MTFDYPVYLRTNFYGPVFLVAAALFVLIRVTCRLLRERRQSSVERILGSIMVIAVCVCCLYFQGAKLIRGGFWLPFEVPRQAQTTVGTIQEIYYDTALSGSKYQHHSQNGRVSFGVRLVIQGEEYQAVAADGFQEGDRVLITFLPRSRFILNIQSSESSS